MNTITLSPCTKGYFYYCEDCPYGTPLACHVEVIDEELLNEIRSTEIKADEI